MRRRLVGLFAALNCAIGAMSFAQEAATAERAAGVIDLRTFPLPQGGKPVSPPSLGTLSYEWRGSPESAMEYVVGVLQSRGWTEMASPVASDQMVNSRYSKEGFTMTVMTSPSFNNRRLAFVALKNTGDVDVEKLPMPTEAKRTYSAPGNATYVMIGDKQVVIDQCRRTFAQGGWELFTDSADLIVLRQNGLLVQLFFNATDDETNEISITAQTVLMSFDISAPTGSTGVFYDDSTSGLHFTTTKSPQEIGRFYTELLSPAGWKPQTPEPVKEESFALEPTTTETMTFTNGAGDQINMEILARTGGNSARVTHKVSPERK